jgi:8-oxo-dGTP pyrophosphatase MutT (NUDIX family)
MEGEIFARNASGCVLILRRALGSAEGKWCLPGGKIDYGDTVEAAAVYELLEETGPQAPSLLLRRLPGQPAAECRRHALH